jgi:hypothetical protein
MKYERGAHDGEHGERPTEPDTAAVGWADGYPSQPAQTTRAT